jgi:hypothetical protein
MKNAFDPKRPYNGQCHTDFGERGKTIVIGLTMRDIVDCYCKGLLLATMPETDLLEDKTLSRDHSDWEYNDIYKVRMAIDPGAVHQNMMCEVEKMMGIYPNVPKLITQAETKVPEFTEFPKIYRVSRPVIITEKIDGTNAQICITEEGDLFTGSKTRWITPEDDNYGFARWAMQNKEELLRLGVGRHYGEWWGQGIQRTYGLKEKRFSLFNTTRWADATVRPACCSVVPVLYEGMFDTTVVDDCIRKLREVGSIAVPGFTRPEGVVCYHIQGNFGLKKTLEKDEEHKSQNKNKKDEL